MRWPELAGLSPSADLRMAAELSTSVSAFRRIASAPSDQASADVVGQRPPSIAGEHGRVGIPGPAPTATTTEYPTFHRPRKAPLKRRDCHSMRLYSNQSPVRFADLPRLASCRRSNAVAC